MARALGKVLVAALAMGAATWWLVGTVYGVLDMLLPTVKLAQIGSVLIAVAGGMAVYLAVARLVRCEECGEALDAVRRRGKRTAA
jgi:hypothetical protein